MLPAQADGVGHGDIQRPHEQQGGSGVAFPLLDEEQVGDAHEHHQNAVSHGGGKLLVIASFEHVFHGFAEKQHRDVRKNQHEAHTPVQRYGIGVPFALPKGVGQDKRRLQAQQIQEDEVKMLQPPFRPLFIHSSLSPFFGSPEGFSFKRPAFLT